MPRSGSAVQDQPSFNLNYGRWRVPWLGLQA
jgi:hypothetical protein